MAKKRTIKIKEIKTSPEKVDEGTSSMLGQSEERKILEEKPENEEVNSSKFFEFLSPSTESLKIPAGRKPRAIKRIEQDKELLAIPSKEEDKKKDEKKDYFTKAPRDYELFSPREEKNQSISIKAFQPSRIDFREVGRDIKMQPRDFFVPNEDMIRMNSPRKADEERKYDIERVDFTEVGREKRYKIMK